MFNLLVDCTVEQLPREFGIRNIRNADAYLSALPEEIWMRVWLPNLSWEYDSDHQPADWAPAIQAVRRRISEISCLML